MGNKNYFLLIVCFCLLKSSLLAPLGDSQVDADFCTGDDFLKYENGKEYSYDYSTQTDLWINDVSQESKSSVELKAKVFVRSVKPCLYLLRLQDTSITGESINQKDLEKVLLNLNVNSVQFRFNSRGELDSNVDFSEGDSAWSRNVKRGILSALQVRSVNSLRNLDQLSNTNDAKSTVVYETDVLGRCRTTYSVKNPSSSDVVINKRKSLQRCTLNENSKTSAVQYVPYKSIPEFYQGRLFVETHECQTQVKNGLIDQVTCVEKSTYKVGSRGDKGVQAVVKQTLKYLNTASGYDRRAQGPFETLNVKFEFSDKSVDDLEFRDFNVDRFLSDLCSRVDKQDGLDNEHSNNFRALVNTIESKSTSELNSLYSSAKGKCKLAGKTVLQALVFGNTENTFDTVLKLLDENAFSDQILITEYPVLTALARLQEPSLNFLRKLNTYLKSKENSFVYLRKLFLVYSTLVKTHCSKNECNAQLLDELSSLFASNLGSNCVDSTKKDLVTASLKAIGNIGYFKNVDTLIQCASNKANNLETRISAVQAFRRFDVNTIINTKGLVNLLTNTDEDTELRINAFQVLIRCIETERFQVFARDSLPTLLEKETDLQVLTYIVDFAKERGLTALLNPILSNQQIKERFSVNFKELSWNNFKYRYSLNRDGAVELDTSVIYASDRSFIPRSIRFNTTLHLFGMSVNFADVTLRTEGLEDVLKSVLIDKLTSEQLLKRLMSNPEQIIDIVKTIADKLKYTKDKPFLSILIRVYGSDVFYSELDTLEELKRLSDFLRNPRERLVYAQVNTIKNMFLVDSRVRQPLLNGFEFNTFMDSSFGLLLIKQSSKEESNDKRTFKVNNFYSASLAINKRFEIQINKDNKLSLKKKANLNARLRLDIQGEKTNDSAVYNWNLTPLKEIPLVVFEGKFFKLSSNSQYNEVTKFDVERRTLKGCTSDNFHSGFGIDLCLSVDRPQIGSIRESLKPVDFDSVLNNVSDDDDDDDDDEEDDEEEKKVYGSVQRPKLVLSGPYRFEVTLKNPEDVKTITLNGKRVKTDTSKTINLALSTTSSTNKVLKRLEFVYSRNRVDTNRGIERHLNIELKNANTQDVRFKLSGDIVYKKQQVLDAHFQLQNKILRELNLNLHLLRQKENKDDKLPTYKLEALLDSKLNKPKYRKLSLTFEPKDGDIQGNFVVERSDESTENKLVKLAEGNLKLKAKTESKTEYDVHLDMKTARPSNLHIHGTAALTLFKSNVDLSVEYSGPRIKLEEPALIKFGHQFDASSPDAKSFVEFGVKLTQFNVNHNLKLVVAGDIEKFQLNHFEVQVKTPKSIAQSNGLPYTFYISKNINVQGEKRTFKLSIGLENIFYDLAQKESKLAKSLIKLDSKSVVNSITVEYERSRDSSAKKLDVSLKANKNGVVFANLRTSLFGNLNEIKANPSEVPKQSFGATVQIKAFENSAGIDAKLDVESSVKSQRHLFNFDLKTESLLRILIKVASIKAKLSVNGNKVEAEYEMKKIGEVRSFGFSSKKNAEIRKSADGFKEFDVDYTKSLASGQQLKSSGTVRYKFQDLKNFETTMDIKNSFRYQLSVKNERKLKDKVFGVHDINLRYAHLDANQAERELKVYIDNEAQPNTLVLNVVAKKGQPDKLSNLNELDYLVDLNTKNTFWYKDEKRRLENGANTLVVRIKKFNLDLSANCVGSLDKSKNKFNLNSDLDLKFPALVSQPGKQNYLKHKLTLNKNVQGTSKTISSSLESDNKFLNAVFKSLNVDYSRQPVSSNLTSVNLNVKYVNPNDESKFVTLNVERTVCDERAEQTTGKNNNDNDDSDEDDVSEEFWTGSKKVAEKWCHGTKVNIKQNLLASYQSRVLDGKTLDTSDCTLETRFIGNKKLVPSYNYLSDDLVSAECKNIVFIREGLVVRRFADQSRDGKTTTELSLILKSDLYYQQENVDVKWKKFYAKSGLIEVKWQRNSAKLFAVKVAYNRELETTSNKLSKGNYVFNTEIGTSTYKNCEMNIESKQNYYNRLVCKVKTSKLPVELSYGYALKVNNVKELPNGKRDIEVNVDLPSTRQLRVEYQSTRAVLPQQQFDDDDDTNNDREFSSNIKYFWDNSNDKSKVLQLSLKRDNYAKTNSKFTAEATSPSFKLLKLVVDKKRLFNETQIEANIAYELKNNVKNELEISSRLSSDFDTNTLSLELSLARPSFNVLYENRFNKLNGRLQYLSVRLGKLLKFSVDKEYDPENRFIKLELVSPDESKFKVESTSKTTSRNVHVVQTTLRQLSTNQVLSTLESSFDSNNNVFNVNLNAIRVNKQYRVNVGFYNESLANAVINDVTNNNQVLGVGSLEIVKINDEEITDNQDSRYLQLSLKWNRLWNKIYNDALANQGVEVKAVENSGFNSYFGDVYGSLVNDLKPTYETIRAERRQVMRELKQVPFLLLDYYSSALPVEVKAKLTSYVEAIQKQRQEEDKKIEELPLHKRLAYKYNKLAVGLNKLHFKVKKYSKLLASYVPRLTMINFNKQDQMNKMVSQFDNELVAQRPTNNARNLYQFNAEYRDLLRRFANRYLSVKSNLLRNIKGASLRALINKYKFRSVRDYTMVAHIFNRRNLVAFNGESKVLKSRCKFLLAHELTRNQFSVILNSNTDKAWISVSAYGQATIDINGNSASINNKALALPHTVELSEKNARVVVKKSFNSVSVQVNNDLLVTCYEDSKSCSVALTRWYTGKVNGLLGRSNHNLDQVDEDHWYLEKSCKLPNFQSKVPSDEAIKTCYSIFGKHRRAVFRNAIQAINPTGWQKLCELALNADISNKCPVMRAFVYHARLRSIEVNEPNECFQCQAKGKSVLVGQKYTGPSTDLFENGNDYVFVFLPCDKSKYSLDLSASARKLSAKNPGNRYYFVKVHENNGASVYQSESGQTFNFDAKKAYQTIAQDKTEKDLQKGDLYNALFLAGSLFTNRLAQNRFIVIVGCGNCIKYSSRAAILVNRLLTKRNIVVSAWDEYNIVDQDSTDDQIIGYGQNTVFLNKQGTNKIETDELDSYNFEHRGDLCSRLAAKTNGNVFNINLIKRPQIFEQVVEKLAELTPKYDKKLASCERVDTPFGDVDDFSYKRVKLE